MRYQKNIIITSKIIYKYDEINCPTPCLQWMSKWINCNENSALVSFLNGFLIVFPAKQYS